MAPTTVEIGCAVFGCGDIFPMAVARHTRVHKLRDAIFQQHPYGYDRGAHAAMLRLFIAKDRDTGAWLEDNEALDALLEASPDVVRAKRFVRMRLLRPLDDSVNFGTNFPVGGGRVHVLIQLPRLPALDPRAYDIHSTLLFHVLVDENEHASVGGVTPDATAQDADEKALAFQHQLMVVYKCAVSTTTTGSTTMTAFSTDTLRCMLLDTALPSALVTAVHVFPRRNAFLVEQGFLLPLDDVDDVTNGLLLVTPLACAFENFQLCFVEDDHERSETWRLKLTDPTLRPQRLLDYVDHRTGAKAIGDLNFLEATPEALTTTFGALEGRAIAFRSGVRPMWQCMNLHARLARAKASRDQWIEPWAGTKSDDFWSDGLTAVERMERLYAHDTPFSE